MSYCTSYWFGIAVSLSFMVMLVSHNGGSGRGFVRLLSEFSYELYLTHSMILVAVSLKKMTGNMLAGFALFVMLSFFSAFALKKLSKVFTRILP